MERVLHVEKGIGLVELSLLDFIVEIEILVLFVGQLTLLL